ncbi:WAT1-related protein At1g25270-like isoform X3 [Hevea brasiliensis]|uniref:WAT1-related protein At1g25270-like isoform X3 n=1 Tax=Hevea brasiliensis TaxID=3981 RepID=UPI0025CF224C|nr:WAT1-related protein At1g25270-like isoform X3 [Hevea brasiliensis]
MRHVSEVINGLKPEILMIFIQFSYAGMNIFYKLAANDGMNLRVLVAYRWIFSTAFIAPFALFFDRRKRPKLTWMILVQAFLSGLFGGMLAQNLYVESLVLTSATFAAAITNLIPAITLILATTFGLEKLELKTTVGKAKILGLSIGIGGAMLLTFYKGVEIKIWSTNVHLLKHSHQIRKSHFTAKHIVGSSLALGSCISYAMWLILQGIVTSGLVVTLIAWCVRIRGPVFVASFNPLSLVLVAIAGSLLLEEKLHLGSILGGGLIVCGLYLVLWGQSKEMKVKPELVPTTKGSPTTELVEVVAQGDLPALNASSFTHEAASLPEEQQQEQN